MIWFIGYRSLKKNYDLKKTTICLCENNARIIFLLAGCSNDNLK